MGRYSFLPQNVQKHTAQLLSASQIKTPPPWYAIVSSLPPSVRLTRPPMQRPQQVSRKNRRSSRLYRPVNLSYEEDTLRWEFFNDHPWELANPRVMVEGDGSDGVARKWDWSLPLDYALERPQVSPTTDRKTGLPIPINARAEVIWERNMRTQSGRPINGEAVVQRQSYLINNTDKTPSAAYDIARKEFYRYRHYREIETRVAHEEALAVGAFFGLGPLEIGMGIEDHMYENWRLWAVGESKMMKQLQGGSYGGVGQDGDVEEELATEQEEAGSDKSAIKELADAVPGSKTGQEMKGGAPLIPSR